MPNKSLALGDHKIATNMLTFLILMRIDRAEGAKTYLSKS